MENKNKSIEQCTSPGQLQDVTMDNSYAMGYRSPPMFNVPLSGGTTSPGHGRSIREHDEQLNALRKENFNLKLRIYFMEEKNSASILPDGSESLQKENVDLKVQTEALRVELKEKQDLLCEAATALELMEQSQKSRENDCQLTIDKLNSKIQYLQREIKSMEKNPNHSNCSLYNDHSSTECDLKLVGQSNVPDVNETEKLLRQQQEEVDLWQQKYKEMYDKFTTSSISLSNSEFCSKQDRSNITMQLDEKDCEIETLQHELKKQTSTLNQTYKTIQFFLSKIKSLEAEIAELKDNPKGQHHNESYDDYSIMASYQLQIEKLKTEINAAHEETAEANKWREECANLCGILTIRLKELAEFLDSLLNNKDMLGCLAQDRRKAMRKAVDRSLNLSNSLNNISLSVTNRLSLNETNVNNIRNLSDAINLSIENHESFYECDFEEMFSKLVTRCEISKSSKRERKNHPADLNSDSEAWSEPDRNVSLARIGLEEPSKLINNGRVSSKCNDESKSSTASEHDISKLSRKKYQERVAQLELLIAEKDRQILNAQCELVESDNRLKEEHAKLAQLTENSEAYKNENEMLQIEIGDYKAKIQEKTEEITCLRNIIKEKMESIETLAAERDASDVNLRVATLKLMSLQEDIDEMKSRHNNEIDEIIANQTKLIEELKQELLEEYKSEREKDWIHKTVHEETANELKDAIKRLSELKSIADGLKETENELNAQLIDAEKNIRSLRKSLDDATIQASKMAVERTKAMKLNSDLTSKLDEAINIKTELNSRIGHLEKTNAQLQNSLIMNDTRYKLTKSASQGNARYMFQFSDQSQSEFTSDETKQRFNNPSPDLGIESDTVRTSGSENVRPTKLREVTASMGNIMLEVDEEDVDGSKEFVSNNSNTGSHDCAKVDKENAELKRKLQGTHNAYNNILAQLKISNNRKEQVERDIRREICKTQNVLKNVRTNIENVAKTSPSNGYKSEKN